MNMDSTRRSLDRSSEPGAKKPRLIDELDRSSRPLPQRQPATTLASARFRTNDRDSESSDSGRGGGYQPQAPPQQGLAVQYKTALAELTFNSKPIITNLTIIAGENLSAAKTIAATVFANILEVPSEQKLPSLYLVDSIVKNIGRDYIKYFAAGLPEVFCKAYRQVDPSVHSSMKHLFGTWKGVFPPQSLQMIEKELGFAPAVNSSAPVSATVRSDLQSHCPPHSIHVNPMYVERQRLQQSSRNNQHTHRDAFNDSVPEKSIGGSHGSSEYSSGIANNLVSGVGITGRRLTDLRHDKTWFKTGSGVADNISRQRNGFNLKIGFTNHETSKPMSLDAHCQPTQHITNTRSNVMSSNWKNSEEEEFMWDEMNSGLTDPGSNVSSNLSTDSWVANEENLEGGDHLRITHPFAEKVDRQISTVKKQLPGFGGHPQSSWQLQKQLAVDKLNLKPGHSEAVVSTLSGLPGNAGSLAVRTWNRSFMPNTTVEMAKILGQQFDSGGTESPSDQSPLRPEVPSPAVMVHHPPSMQCLADQEITHNLRASLFSGVLGSNHIRDPLNSLCANIQVGNLGRSQEKDVQGPLSSAASFQQKLQQLQQDPSHSEITIETKKPPQSKVSLARETSEESTTNNLSATAVKSGIVPQKSIISSPLALRSIDARNHPSESRVQPTQSGGPSLTKLISSRCAVASPSSLPQEKAGQLQKISTQAPASSNVSSSSALSLNAAYNNTLNPIANLLSSLVAKGLISSKTESPTRSNEVSMGSKDHTEIITTSCTFSVVSGSGSGSAAVPIPSSSDVVDGVTKTYLASPQSTSTEIRNLIGFDFRPDVIREFHPSVIRELLDDLPHHCRICEVRLKKHDQYNRHLEWHATREREKNHISRASRRWYAKSSDWIAGKAECSSEFEFSNSVDVCEEKPDKNQLDAMVLADENQCLCVLCGELFEEVYCQEREEWMFTGAVYMNYSDNNSEMESINIGPIIHARCLSENSISGAIDTVRLIV